MWRRSGLAVLLVYAAAAGSAAATELREFLVLPAVGDYGRMPLHRDAVEADIVTGAWKSPTAGDEIHVGERSETWRAASAGRDGTLDTSRLRGGYALATLDAEAERVALLEARGHAAVYVNGRPRAGDPYQLGWMKTPVQLKQGRNDFLFHVGGDQLSARCVEPAAEVSFNEGDLTLPTLVFGESEPEWGAVPIVNASRLSLVGTRLVCRQADGTVLATPVPVVQPLAVQKAAFQFPVVGDDDDRVKYRLSLVRTADGDSDSDNGNAEKTLADLEIELSRVGVGDVQVRTFRSTIDGSVQRYAVRAAASKPDVGDASDSQTGTRPALILALHDAGESCEDMVRQYATKDWAHVVAPTGRRDYGFDWEDWGRIDALEALADAQHRYPCDPARVYLTGHSMGGHGTWHLGVTYPASFAAVGPIGGWASFWSYGGGMPTDDDNSPIDQMLLRGYSPSDTLKLIGNLRDTGVCILHDEHDPTVPVAQSRFMRSRLAEFHSSFAYFEDVGAESDSGEGELDAPQLMDFFQNHRAPSDKEVKLIDFVTASPGVSHGAHWVSIEAQVEPLEPSRVAVQQDVVRRTFAVKTINVARLAMDVGHLEPSPPIHVAIDGQTLPELEWPAGATRLWFARAEDGWEIAGPPEPGEKGPHRDGTFKSVFDNHAMLVFGTRGTPEENAWAAAKARFDAETFWYRGNGSLEVVADTEFRPEVDPDRNVVLYGNAETNGAWPALLSTSPVQVRHDDVRVGVRPEAGDDLAVLLVRPRAGSDRAVVGVVGGTGLVGMRLTTRLRYFVSGVAYPDLLIFGPGVLTDGTGDVRAAGYFGIDWGVDSGEIEWRDVAL